MGPSAAPSACSFIERCGDLIVISIAFCPGFVSSLIAVTSQRGVAFPFSGSSFSLWWRRSETRWMSSPVFVASATAWRTHQRRDVFLPSMVCFTSALRTVSHPECRVCGVIASAAARAARVRGVSATLPPCSRIAVRGVTCERLLR